MFIISNGGSSTDFTQIMCHTVMIPFSSHSLALHWEKQRPLTTFQEDIYLCGFNGESEETGIKWFLPHSSGSGFYLLNKLIAFLATMNQIASLGNEICCQTFPAIRNKSL
jgi:hypothetical protein